MNPGDRLCIQSPAGSESEVVVLRVACFFDSVLFMFVNLLGLTLAARRITFDCP